MPLRIRRVLRMILLCLGLATAAANAAPPRTPIEQPPIEQPPIERRLTPAQMHDTGLDTLRPEQLALLNRLLQETARDASALPASPPTTASTGDVRPVAPDPTAFAGLQDGPQKAELAGTLEGWQPGTVFELRNGQQWQVLKGKWRLSKPLSNAPVTLVPGVMGRWFLQVDDTIPMARVQRIR